MNKVDPKYKYYIHELGDILKTRALGAKKERKKTMKDSPEYHFETGKIIAFNEVILV